MKQILLLLFPLCLITLSPALPAVYGWGFQAHRIINERAVYCLPGDLQPFFRANLRYIREHSIDPDLSRQAGIDEDINHFQELDTWGEDLYRNVPADERTFLERHGQSALQHGRLLWRILELYHQLSESLRAGRWETARLQAAVVGHYIADAHVPLHAIRNFDGQLSGNKGIHARWEVQLVERFEQQILSRLKVQKITAVQVTPRWILELLRASYQTADSILKHDTEAAAGLQDYLETPEDDRYSDTYYSRLFATEGWNLEQRMQASIASLATLWYSAWVDAGSPAYPADLRDLRVRGDNRLVILSWDGTPPVLMTKMLRERKLPSLASLIQRSAYSSDVATGLPSLTAPGHAAIWTGAWGNRNGITGNKVPFSPSLENSVLDASSGFSSEALRAEPIWVTAARQGLNVLVLQGMQAFPFEPFTTGKRFGGNQNSRLTLIDGYFPELAKDNLVVPDNGLQSPKGWRGLPPMEGEAKEFSFTVSSTSLFGVAFNSPCDPVYGFDTVVLTTDKSDPRRFLILKPAESAGKDAFGEPLWLGQGEGKVPIYFRLFQLDNRSGEFILYHSWVYRRTSNKPELVDLWNERIGGFWGHGALILYRQGRFGKPLAQGGSGVAELRYLETVSFALRQYASATILAMKQMKWDLLINYLPFPDEVGHAWFGWLDPSNPGFDESLALRLTPYLEQALIMQDEVLGNIVQSLPPHAGLALVSDHGVQGVAKDFLPNVVLQQAGLLSLNSEGQVDLSRSSIYAASDGNFLLLNSKNRKNGIVDSEEAEGIIERATQALLNVRDSETGLPVVSRVYDPRFEGKELGIGGPTGGELYYELEPGYAPQGALTGGPVVNRPIPMGNHSLSRRTAQTGFVLTGPGIMPCRDVGHIRLVDLAPTLCWFLGIDPSSATEGRILSEVFQPAGN